MLPDTLHNRRAQQGNTPVHFSVSKSWVALPSTKYLRISCCKHANGITDGGDINVFSVLVRCF